MTRMERISIKLNKELFGPVLKEMKANCLNLDQNPTEQVEKFIFFCYWMYKKGYTEELLKHLNLDFEEFVIKFLQDFKKFKAR